MEAKILEDLLDQILSAEVGDTIEDGHGNQYVVHRSRNGCRFIQLDDDSIFMEQNKKKNSRYARMARKGRKIGWVIPTGGGKWRLVMLKQEQLKQGDDFEY